MARDAMPDWARERVDGAASRNIERLRRFEDLYRAIDHDGNLVDSMLS